MRPAAVALLLTGCLSQHLGPAVLRPDWDQPRRDPDPTTPLVDDQPINPLVPEADQRAPGSPRARGERAAATLAAVLAGAIPSIVWWGTFDENRWFGAQPDRQRRPTATQPTTSDETSSIGTEER